MRFLGGFLKFIAIVILVIATAICAVMCVMAGVVEAYIVMGLAWVCASFVALNIWGTGMALGRIHKLEQRIEQLEQRGVAAPYAYSHGYEAPAAPVEEGVVPPVLNPAAPAPSTKKSKSWIPAVVISAVVVVIVAVVVVALVNGGNQPNVMDTDNDDRHMSDEQEAEETLPFEEEPTISESTPVVDITELGIGGTVATDFVEMTFTDVTVAADVKHSVTTGFVTRITGPEPVAGQQYICLTGTIKNISTSPLPVYDFFVGNFDVDGYSYTVDANDCDILDGEGQTKTEIDPLMEYTFRIYVAIPNELADSHSSCKFTFGFYDGFDNADLSYSRAFSDDPIADCPYQYAVKIK